MINPIYKNLINSGGAKTAFKNKKHKNNWIKALICIFVLAILMMSVGVPVYDGLIAMENNAIPYEFGNIGNLNVKTSSTSGMGGIIWFETQHFGQIPTVKDFVAALTQVLIGAGLGYVVGLIVPGTTETVVQVISVSLEISFEDGTTAIAEILLVDISTVTTNPVGWGVLIGIASGIVAF